MDLQRLELDVLMERVERGDHHRVRSMLLRAPHEHLTSLRAELESTLRDLPVPLTQSHPVEKTRRVLLRLRDTIDACRGDENAMLRDARERWLAGGSHAEYLGLLLRYGQTARAISMAIALLDANERRDRAQLEALLGRACLAPSGWGLAVARFAAAPSVPAWRRLLRFTPCEVYQARVRYTLRILLQLGVPTEVVFRYATLDGATPEAIGLAEEGAVSPRVVEERARASDEEGQVLWYGLAARAACVRGDHLGTIRLLRAAYRASRGSTYDPERDLSFVRDHADPALHGLLANAGFSPRLTS